MDDELVNAGDGDDALVSQLRVIEDQPIERRAEAYAALHERLSQRLEGSDEFAD